MNLSAHKKMLSAAAAASVLLLTAACGSDEKADADDSAPATTSAPSADATSASPEAAADGTYANGEYSAEGSYVNPGGTSSVDVELTLEDGIVTAIEVEPQASGTSLQFQKKFVSGIADEVVGKSIDDLKVSKVAGSSLTSGGFNEAIEQIKGEARA